MIEGCLAIGKGLAANVDSTLELLDLDDIVAGKEFVDLKLGFYMSLITTRFINL